MMPLYVISTTALSGKTAICVALGRRFKRDGIAFGYIKPVSREVRDFDGVMADGDAVFVRRIFDLPEPLDILCPVVLSPETAGQAGYEKKVKAALEHVSQGKKVVLAEGAADGPPAPEVARLLGAQALLVLRYAHDLSPDKPLAISFPTKEPFYPLRISAISAAPANELLLLTLTHWAIVPRSCAWTVLRNSDVKQALGPELARRAGSPLESTLDFTPAIRAAQRRMGKPGLVIESVTERRWHFTEDRLDYASDAPLGERMRVTRFHAILGPEDMVDVAFRPALPADRFPWHGPLPGHFGIMIDDVPEAWLPSAPRVAVLGGGLVLAALALVGRWRRRELRFLALALVFLGLGIGL